ncbi:MAG: holo-ACP synthase [bacterium]
MIRGVGCDICDIARIRPELADRILSAPERRLYDGFTSEKRQREFLAGRFAVKEAILKAAPEKRSILAISTFIVVNDEDGRPRLEGDPFPGCRAWLSISHDGGYAIGLCVIETIDS